MRRDCWWGVVLGTLTFALAFPSAARGLPEALVLPRGEWYPLREQDRGYLCRYADQPLFVDPDLPEDPPHPRFSTRRHRFWGEWFSQADWEACERLARDSLFDGLAFFPRPHRARYWEAMATSPQRDFPMVPIAYSYSEDGSDLSRWWGKAVASPRAYRVNGKALILSYRFSGENSPARVQEKLARMTREFGDKAVFVCDLSRYLLNTDEFVDHGCLRPETAAKWREIIRDYLRVCGGVIVGDVFSVLGFEGAARNRVFNVRHYEEVVRLLREVCDEPEFRGKKLLGLAAAIAHDNTTRQFWTASEDGLRTLTESLRIAAAAEPDVLLLPEWDELNENTCVGPTLMNGFAVKRIINFFQSRLRRRPLRPLPGDDLARPNLVVSYRRNCSPGEKLVVDVLNVPDGARSGLCAVQIEVLGDQGETLFSPPMQRVDEAALAHLRFPLDSATLATQARAPRIVLRWRKGEETEVVAEGLSPINLAPANGWCLKEVHQPIRDLAPIVHAELVRQDEEISVSLASEEPLRYVFLQGNGEILHVAGNPNSAAARFQESATQAVFQVFAVRHQALDEQSGWAYRVKGVSSAAWLDWHGEHVGDTLTTDWIAMHGDPYFVRLPRSEVDRASVEFDFNGLFKGSVPLKTVWREGAYMLSGTNGAQFMVTRMRQSARYPSVANVKALSFRAPRAADQQSAVYYVTALTMSGRTWRSRPLVVEPASSEGKMTVFSSLDDRVRTIALPKARIPRLVYDFTPGTGDYLPTTDRFLHFATVLGGRYSPITLWNRTATSAMDYPEGFSPAYASGTVAQPQRVQESDGAWALDFRDANAFVAFPWETLPQNAAYRLVLRLKAGNLSGKVPFIVSKSVLNIVLENGEIVVNAPGLKAFRTGLKLTEGRWQTLCLEHGAETFVVRLDDQESSASARLRATFMSPFVLRFNGRIRDLVVDQGL
ncbi:MAG: hypothetical protein MJ240_06545 [Kiritimatiellae bacterium]|nr:hypothetical protein [Kiritimatiellia bacterium]